MNTLTNMIGYLDVNRNLYLRKNAEASLHHCPLFLFGFVNLLLSEASRPCDDLSHGKEMSPGGQMMIGG